MLRDELADAVKLLGVIEALDERVLLVLLGLLALVTLMFVPGNGCEMLREDVTGTFGLLVGLFNWLCFSLSS